MAKRIELTDSGVVFNEELHEYWLGDKQLSGITEALRQMLTPDIYKNIPGYIIKNAALYGSSVHHDLQRFDQEYINSGSQEVLDYIQICKDNSLLHEASEYTVSDGGVHWASNIDKVFRTSDSTFSLADIKTYSKLTPDKELLAKFQLSIYAMWFEAQNKGAKVDRLYIIRLRNKEMKSGKVEHVAELIAVDRIPAEICQDLLNCYITNETFHNPLDVPKDIAIKAQRLKELIAIKTAAEDELNAIKADILQSMIFLDVKSWATSDVRLTRTLPTTRQSFDLAKFKAAHQEITDYELYMKTSNVSGSLKVAI